MNAWRNAATEILKGKGVVTRIVTAASGEPEDMSASSDGAADPDNGKVWGVALDVARSCQAWLETCDRPMICGGVFDGEEAAPVTALVATASLG